VVEPARASQHVPKLSEISRPPIIEEKGVEVREGRVSESRWEAPHALLEAGSRSGDVPAWESSTRRPFEVDGRTHVAFVRRWWSEGGPSRSGRFSRVAVYRHCG
jgi:hypothetical protein